MAVTIYDFGQESPWFDAPFSMNNGNCVEIKLLADGRVLMRDSKDRKHSPIWVFTASQWAAFIAALQGGMLNPLSTDDVEIALGGGVTFFCWRNDFEIVQEGDGETLRPLDDPTFTFERSDLPGEELTFSLAEIAPFKYAVTMGFVGPGPWQLPDVGVDGGAVIVFCHHGGAKTVSQGGLRQAA